MELIVAFVRKATRVILSEDVLTLMNVAADLSMVVASVPPVSTAFPGTHANVHPVSVETDVSVVNRLKYVRVANPISTVPTMPNVVQIEPVDAEKASSPTEPCVLTLMNARGNPGYVAPQQPAPTPRVGTSAVVRPP